MKWGRSWSQAREDLAAQRARLDEIEARGRWPTTDLLRRARVGRGSQR
jgi:hypothetical protein